MQTHITVERHPVVDLALVLGLAVVLEPLQRGFAVFIGDAVNAGRRPVFLTRVAGHNRCFEHLAAVDKQVHLLRCKIDFHIGIADIAIHTAARPIGDHVVAGLAGNIFVFLQVFHQLFRLCVLIDRKAVVAAADLDILAVRRLERAVRTDGAVIVRQVVGKGIDGIFIDRHGAVFIAHLHLVEFFDRDGDIPVEHRQGDLLRQIGLAVVLVVQQSRIVLGDIRQLVVVGRIERQRGFPGGHGLDRLVHKTLRIDVVSIILRDDREPFLRLVDIGVFGRILRLSVKELLRAQILFRLVAHLCHHHVHVLCNAQVAGHEFRHRQTENVAVQKLIDLRRNVIGDLKPRDLPDLFPVFHDGEDRVVARVCQRCDRLFAGHAGAVDAVDDRRIRESLRILFIVGCEHKKTRCQKQRADHDR